MCLTIHPSMLLDCKSMSFTHTLSLDQNTNCCFVCSTAGNNNHLAFISTFHLPGEPSCFLRHYGLTAAKGEINTDSHKQSSNIQNIINTDLPRVVSPFETILEENEELDDRADKMAHSTDELLRIHYKLGQMYFAKIRFMSSIGWLERKLAKCEIPKCAGCLYGKSNTQALEDKRSPQQHLKDQEK